MPCLRDPHRRPAPRSGVPGGGGAGPREGALFSRHGAPDRGHAARAGPVAGERVRAVETTRPTRGAHGEGSGAHAPTWGKRQRRWAGSLALGWQPCAPMPRGSSRPCGAPPPALNLRLSEYPSRDRHSLMPPLLAAPSAPLSVRTLRPPQLGRSLFSMSSRPVKKAKTMSSNASGERPSRNLPLPPPGRDGSRAALPRPSPGAPVPGGGYKWSPGGSRDAPPPISHDDL